MSSWKNPFKFTSTRPAWEELYKKIKSTYRASIEEFSIQQIHVYTFFHLSTGAWDSNKYALLDISTFKKMLKSKCAEMPGIDSDIYRSLFKYKSYLKRYNPIPDELFLSFLISSNSITAFEKIFEETYSSLAVDIEHKDLNSPAYKIMNRDRIMGAPFEYITLIESDEKLLVNSKSELEEHIFTEILRGHPSIKQFEINKTNQKEGPEDALSF